MNPDNPKTSYWLYHHRSLRRLGKAPGLPASSSVSPPELALSFSNYKNSADNKAHLRLFAEADRGGSPRRCGKTFGGNDPANRVRVRVHRIRVAFLSTHYPPPPPGGLL